MCIRDREKLGKKVVVIGGSSVAAEAACYLAECGHEVVEISRQGRLAYDLNPIRSIGYMNQKADQLGVQAIKKAKTTKIEPGRVTYVDRKGAERTVDCDDVVACGGMEPNSASAIAFRDAAPEFYMLGDCRHNGKLRNAIREAYALALRICAKHRRPDGRPSGHKFYVRSLPGVVPSYFLKARDMVSTLL